MPYVFRGRDLKDKDVLDPTEMNEDIQPYVELLSGNVDAENINATDFKSNIDIRRDAYVKPYYKEVVCHPRFGNIEGGNYDGGVDQPNFADASAEIEGNANAFFQANVQPLPNAAGWVPLAGGEDKILGGSPETDFKVVTGATGETNLWINAFVQYVWNGFGFTGDEDDQFDAAVDMGTYDATKPKAIYGGTPPVKYQPDHLMEARWPSLGGRNHLSMGFWSARVQLAIRLDGQVLEHTITGKRSEYETSPLGMRHVTTRDLEDSGTEKNLPGPKGFMRRAVGMGPEMAATRLGTVIRVSPGTHTVEVVARRIAPRGQRTAIQRDIIGIHNRQLSVIEMPLNEGTTIGASSASVPAFESEDSLDLAPSVNQVVDQVNNMGRSTIKASSLRNEHLPSNVRSSSTKSINPGDSYNWTTASFPGWLDDGPGVWGGGTDNVMTSALASARDGEQGWFGVTDSSGNHFTVNNSATVDDDSLIIVMADIRLKTVNTRTKSSSASGRIPLENRLLDSFAGFALGYSEDTSGDTSWRIIPSSRAYINSYNWVGRSVHYTNSWDTDSSATGDKDKDMRLRPRDDTKQPYAEDTFENFSVSLMWVVHGDRLYEKSMDAFGNPLRDIKRVGMFVSGAASPAGGVGSGPVWQDAAWAMDDYFGAPLETYSINPPKIRWGRGRMSLLHLKR